MKLISNLFLGLFVFLLLVVTGFRFYIPNHDIKPASQIWRHRGGKPENSVEGMKKSIQEGYTGIEIDAFYIGEKVLIGHSLQEAQKNSLSFEEVLQQLNGSKVQIWMDFKKQNPKNSFNFAFKLRKILKNHSIENNLFVETKDPITLATLSLARIPVSFWYEPRKSIPRGVYKTLYKVLTWYFKPVWLSSDNVHHSQLNDLLPNKKKAIFTINDTEMIKSYCRTPNLSIILTDYPFERISGLCDPSNL